MRIISILNFKGGTGKSSLAENLSHALALHGQRVLVIDADRQGNASTTLLAKRSPHTLTQVIKEEIPLEQAIFQARENLYVVPSDSDLDKASTYLSTTPESYDTLKDAIQALTNFDCVFIDHAGAYTPVMQAALFASGEMLVPCELEPYATQGLFSMFDKLKRTLRKHVIHNAGIIPYNVDLRYTMARRYLQEMRETFGDLITAPIRTDSTVPRAQSVRQTVFEYDPKSRVAEDFRTLAEDLTTERQEASQ
ncbi:MAG: ParA family protein [Ktedonobacteraceae bacterium]